MMGRMDQHFRPQDAHTISSAALLALAGPDGRDHLHEIRLELARRLNVRTYSTWQAAWNDLTCATPAAGGSLRLVAVRCPDCHGRGFDARHPGRNLARTGNAMMCGRCNGLRRTDLTLRTLYAPPPD